MGDGVNVQVSAVEPAAEAPAPAAKRSAQKVIPTADTFNISTGNKSTAKAGGGGGWHAPVGSATAAKMVADKRRKEEEAARAALEASQQTARSKRAASEASISNRSGTLLTGPLGVVGGAYKARKTLLGG